MLDGETAFKLYDTYGFPLDLTQDALRQRGIARRSSPASPMRWSGRRPRRARTGPAPARRRPRPSGSRVRDKLGATEFLGYDTEKRGRRRSQALVKDGKARRQRRRGRGGAIVVNQTPFYGESGGQMGDTGMISGEGCRVEVTDTQKKADGLFVHVGKVTEGTVKTGDCRRARGRSCAPHAASAPTIRPRICCTRRCARCSATMSRRRVRWSRPSGCASTSRIPSRSSAEELDSVEDMANEIVLQNAPVTTRLMAVDDAIAEGAMALFGEKYGDEVRVVSMGTGLRGDKAGRPYSVELCGGTHVRRTGDIGLVAVVGESAVAAGVRRIEALTGEARARASRRAGRRA